MRPPPFHRLTLVSFRLVRSTGVDYCVQRAVAYAPYCDMLWMETAKPDLHEAAEFAHGVHASVPGKMLAYNLSPSFNWVRRHDTRRQFMRNMRVEVDPMGRA